MTKLFDAESTDYEFQESMEQGFWQLDRSGSSAAQNKVQSVLLSMKKLAESDEIDLDALAASANNALGEHTSRATAGEIQKIAEVEISDFRQPLP